MARLLLAFAALFLTAWLAGCATLTKSQCETGDWRGIGVSDGMHGYATSRFDEHVKACAEHGITPSRQLYDAGHAEGLMVYCRLDRAADEGLANRPNYLVCTGELGVSFNRVYYEGRQIHTERQRLAEMKSELDDLLGDLAETADAQTRRDLARDVRDLGDDIVDQQIVIARMEQTLRRFVDTERQRLAALGIDG